MYLRRDGSSGSAVVHCGNTTADEPSSTSWRLTCTGQEWIWHGPPRHNCTVTSSIHSVSGKNAVSPMSGTLADASSTSWAVAQLFPFDTFPYSECRRWWLSVGLIWHQGNQRLVNCTCIFFENWWSRQVHAIYIYMSTRSVVYRQDHPHAGILNFNTNRNAYGPPTMMLKIQCGFGMTLPLLNKPIHSQLRCSVDQWVTWVSVDSWHWVSCLDSSTLLV